MRRSRLIAAAFAVALAVPLLGAVAPASATPAPGSGCTSATTPGAVLAWYPGQPGSQSQLELACVFRNDSGNNLTSAAFTAHDMGFAVYHNGSARRIAVNAAAPGATSLTAQASFTGTGLAAWVNRSISGPGIAPRTFVTSVNDATSTLNLNLPTSGAVAAGDVVVVENAPGARSVADAANPAASTITSATANFTAADVGYSIGGTGIPANTVISAVVNATTVTISKPAALTPPVVTIGGALNYRQDGPPYGPVGLTITSTRVVTGVSLSAAGTLNSTIATFQPSDVGLQVTASACDDGLPFTTQYITAVAAPNATVTPGGMTPGRTCDLVIGEPNGNAPADGEVVWNQGVQLNLNPTLVAGSDACANDQPEGFALTGKWYNPGNFQGVLTTIGNRQAGYGTAASPPGWPTSKAIGQIYIETAAASYSVFVMEREAGTAAPNGVTGSYPAGTDLIGSRHYDLTTPFAPTGLALCPSSATSPGLGFSANLAATTSSISNLPTGTGRPGTGQLRNIISRPDATPGYAGTLYMTSDAAAAGPQWIPVGNFRRLCNYPAVLPNVINFQCGAA